MNNPRLNLGARIQPAAPSAIQPQKAPICPVCGGLECLCRPRFFSGQLLTEEDLNRLDRYITGKNRLHNRMLFGWGVVNGLEVTCGPCNNGVVVSTGYALSPCGDDIVVCKDTPVDVCALANACCDSSRSNDCGPYSSPAPQDCQDVEQKWILAICYDEKPSRGVSPLRDTSSQACCSRCNCGGYSGCGCGCHGQQASSRPRLTSTRRPVATCEPTVICEGFRFTVYRPAQARLAGVGQSDNLAYSRGFGALALAGTQLQGDLGQRFVDCVTDLLVLANDLKPPSNATVQDLYDWCCSLRSAFQDYLAQHGGTACNLYDVLNQFTCPDPNQFPNDPAGYQKAIETQIGQLSGVMMQYMYQCLCSALLPPVPPAGAENCVPIATVTLRRKDCRVINICNIDRKFAVTFTSLAYWLSPLEALVNRFRATLDRLCCGGNLYRQAVPLQARQFDHAFAMRSASFVNPIQDEAANAVPRFTQAWAKRSAAGDPRAMILDALGLAKPDGSPYMTPLERANPAQSLLLDNLLVPFLSNLTGQAAAGVTEAAGEAAQPAAAAQPATEQPATPEGTAALQARIDELAAMMDKQQAMIADLQKRLGNQ
jgi:hypothetical protein